MSNILKIVSVCVVVLTFFICATVFWVNYTSNSQTVASYSTDIMQERGKLISYEKVNTVTRDVVLTLFPETVDFDGDLSELAKYDIELYKIVYQTIYCDDIVNASGLIVVPKKEGALSHVQYHHGTLFPYPKEKNGNLDAPSLYDGTYVEKQQVESRVFANFLPSHGYLVSLPDYIGYGESSDLEHPYSVNSELAKESVDMILATRAFVQAIEVETNDNLFLTGWSEGGAISVATQKLIETEYKESIKVTANAPLSGLYNLHFYSKLLTLAFPFLNEGREDGLDFFMWALYGINRYGVGTPVDGVFKYDVKNQLDVLTNRPSTLPSELINLVFWQRAKLLQKFEDNSLVDGWTATAPLYIHHGTADDTVYFDYNAEVFVDKQNKRGANTKLFKYEGHNHESLLELFTLNMVKQFDSHE